MHVDSLPAESVRGSERSLGGFGAVAVPVVVRSLLSLLLPLLLLLLSLLLLLLLLLLFLL